MVQQQEKADKEALKVVFKDKIKVSFMFKVLKQIQKIKNYASNLEIYYKKCHYHSHANLYGFKYPIFI